jgi:hypothetical protein
MGLINAQVPEKLAETFLGAQRRFGAHTFPPLALS